MGAKKVFVGFSLDLLSKMCPQGHDGAEKGQADQLYDGVCHRKDWQGRPNEYGIKNSASNRTDTKLVYRTHLAAFSEWLPGWIFDMRVQATRRCTASLWKKEFQTICRTVCFFWTSGVTPGTP